MDKRYLWKESNQENKKQPIQQLKGSQSKKKN